MQFVKKAIKTQLFFQTQKHICAPALTQAHGSIKPRVPLRNPRNKDSAGQEFQSA